MSVKSIYFTFVLLFVCGPAFADLDDLGDEEVVGQKRPKGEAVPRPTKQNRPDLGSEKFPPIEPVQSDLQPTPGARKDTNKKKRDQNSNDSKKPIHWSANGLKADRSGRIVDLVKNVVVTQGAMRMTADQAKVFFNASDEVEKVIATGNVLVSKKAAEAADRMSAKGNEATFYNAEQKVTLRGRAALWRGGDVVRGKQITYNLQSGWITVDSVEGVVKPGENPDGKP